MIKAVIFDCFGVIVGQGFYNTFASAGGDPKKDKSFIDDMLGQTNLGLISENAFNQAMAEHLGKSGVQWQQDLLKAEQADEDLLLYIVELRKHYKTAVLSNSNKGVLSQKIGDDWLKKCFDEVVCSAEVGLIKPSPAIYKLTAERLGVKPSECVFIDDHELFIRAAESTDMHGILYSGLNNLKKDLEQVLSR